MAEATRHSGDDPPPARGRRRPPAIRRQDLLAVTIRCLARLGPHGTTGRAICREAGVSHGLLRHYFRNPENLLLETYQELCGHFLARFEAVLFAPDGDPRDALARLFAVLFSEQWASRDLLGAWIAFWTLGRTSDAFARASDDYNRRLRDLLAMALARLPRGAGALPLEEAVPILSAVMDGLWLDHCLAPERLPRERAAALCGRTVTRLFDL